MPGTFLSCSNSVVFADRDCVCFECGRDIPDGEPYRIKNLSYLRQALQGRTFCLSGCTKNPVLNILKVKKAHRQGNDGGVAF